MNLFEYLPVAPAVILFLFVVIASAVVEYRDHQFQRHQSLFISGSMASVAGFMIFYYLSSMVNGKPEPMQVIWVAGAFALGTGFLGSLIGATPIVIYRYLFNIPLPEKRPPPPLGIPDEEAHKEREHQKRKRDLERERELDELRVKTKQEKRQEPKPEPTPDQKIDEILKRNRE